MTLDPAEAADPGPPPETALALVLAALGWERLGRPVGPVGSGNAA